MKGCFLSPGVRILVVTVVSGTVARLFHCGIGIGYVFITHYMIVLLKKHNTYCSFTCAKVCLNICFHC